MPGVEIGFEKGLATLLTGARVFNGVFTGAAPIVELVGREFKVESVASGTVVLTGVDTEAGAATGSDFGGTVADRAVADGVVVGRF